MHIFWVFFFPEFCLSCARPGTIFCTRCLSSRQDIIETEAGFLSVFPYRNQSIKKALWLLKYQNHRDIAETFAPFLHDALLSKIAEDEIHFGREYENDKILIVPIPLYSTKRRHRNYNHAGVLAESLVFHDEKTILKLSENTLTKNHATAPQVDMKTRRERLQNPYESFSVYNKETLKRKNIILIDDVTTTGATLREARRVLLKSGAKNVVCLTVAH